MSVTIISTFLWTVTARRARYKTDDEPVSLPALGVSVNRVGKIPGHTPCRIISEKLFIKTIDRPVILGYCKKGNIFHLAMKGEAQKSGAPIG
jgi:hypothetical protein